MKNYLKIPIQLSFLFGKIFGEGEYQSFKDNGYFSDYKKQYIKLIKTLRKSVKDNISISDNFFLDEIYNDISNSIIDCQNAKDLNELNAEIICFLTNFSFLLIGKKPNNFGFDKKHFSKTKKVNSNWKLNDFRSVQYVQSKEQKNDLKNYINSKNNLKN